jgi:hypothetical protein
MLDDKGDGIDGFAGAVEELLVVQRGHRSVGQVFVAAKFVRQVGEEVVHSCPSQDD